LAREPVPRCIVNISAGALCQRSEALPTSIDAHPALGVLHLVRFAVDQIYQFVPWRQRCSSGVIGVPLDVRPLELLLETLIKVAEDNNRPDNGEDCHGERKYGESSEGL
jgi:hypothetical protein